MVSKKYVPSRCDIVWLDFSPHAGYEQAGRRPALVLSSRAYNEKTNRFIVCPITSKIKGYVFEKILPDSVAKIRGAVLIDHVKNMDWSARNVEFCTSADVQFTDSVADIIDGLVH